MSEALILYKTKAFHTVWQFKKQTFNNLDSRPKNQLVRGLIVSSYIEVDNVALKEDKSIYNIIISNCSNSRQERAPNVDLMFRKICYCFIVKKLNCSIIHDHYHEWSRGPFLIQSPGKHSNTSLLIIWLADLDLAQLDIKQSFNIRFFIVA